MSFSSSPGSSDAEWKLSAGDTAIGTTLNHKYMSKPLGDTLITPLLKAYNARHGTKHTVHNVFNIAVVKLPSRDANASARVA